MERLQHALNWIDANKNKPSISPSWFVYFIRCGQFVKVGISTDPRRRMMEMQIGSPHKLRMVRHYKSLTPNEDERRLHVQMDAYRLRGEWFRITDKMLFKLLNNNP